MKSQSVRGKPQRARNLTGRHAIRTGFDQQPENIQPVILGERGEGCDGIYLFHISTNMEVMDACQQHFNECRNETPMAGLTGRTLVAAMCLGQVGNLLPHVVVPAIMTQHLIPLWGLSAAQAGLMASAYAFGYMIAVPLLTTLTDRVDARRILLVGSAVSGLATVMFGLLAHDLVSATILWGLAGIGFAGAYMPGLKALADRLARGDASRSITLYTGSFSIGVGLSFLVAQLLTDAYGWRAAFYVTGAAPLVMIAVCLRLAPCAPHGPHGRLFDFGPVLRNRTALGYILGYGAHCFELYAIRTWIVAFWSFVVAHSNGAAPIGPVAVSVIFTVLSLPASVLGNEAALRYGRHRAITAVMLTSGAVALAIGFNVAASAWLLLVLVVVYGLTVPADSGALTSGTTTSAVPQQRGATLALHSAVGFGLSALGGWGAGVALDAAGGPSQPSAWFAMFTLLAAGVALGPLALWWSSRPL
jgi:predicted MFS family arabinose efflux permease